MHIVHIVEATATGTLAMVRLAANAQAERHQVTVIFSRRPETPRDMERYFHPAVRLMPLAMAPRKAIGALYRLRAYLAQHREAVVHCHSSFAGFLGRLALWGRPNPCFYSPHCIAFMREDLTPGRRRLFVALERIACRARSHYLACSASEAGAIAAALPRARVTTVDNALDPPPGAAEAARPEPLGARAGTGEGRWAVVGVGGLRPQKDPEAFGALAAAFSGAKDPAFLWLGDGPGERRARLEAQGVRVLGWQAPEAVAERLRRCQIFISTSRWEGMPVAVLEALAAGMVVLARDCSGNRDVIRHGENGLLYRTAGEAEAHLGRLLAEPAYAEKLAAPGPEEIRRYFMPAHYAERLALAYRQGLEDGSAYA